MLDKMRMAMYYVLIAVISFIALAFLPLIGSQAGLGWNLPDTTVGWIVWTTTKIIVSIINVLIFHCFLQQAKLNVRNNARYIEAREILITRKIKNILPRSPRKFNLKEYGGKGTSIFFSTALSTIALTQALMTFDYIALLTYLFTIIMGIIFGILEMKKAEDYWTDEFWRYAKMIEQEVSDDNNRSESIQKS